MICDRLSFSSLYLKVRDGGVSGREAEPSRQRLHPTACGSDDDWPAASPLMLVCTLEDHSVVAVHEKDKIHLNIYLRLGYQASTKKVHDKNCTSIKTCNKNCYILFVFIYIYTHTNPAISIHFQY